MMNATLDAVAGGNAAVVRALVHSVEARNEQLTSTMLTRLCAGARVDREGVAKSLNTYQQMTTVDRSDRPDQGAWSKSMDQFLFAKVWMSPMLAATGGVEHGRRGSAPQQFARKSWAAQVIRQLYGLGADFKTHDGRADESMQSMATKDPFYQLIKYQIRDVTDQVVDERRKDFEHRKKDEGNTNGKDERKRRTERANGKDERKP